MKVKKGHLLTANDCGFSSSDEAVIDGSNDVGSFSLLGVSVPDGVLGIGMRLTGGDLSVLFPATGRLNDLGIGIPDPLARGVLGSTPSASSSCGGRTNSPWSSGQEK